MFVAVRLVRLLGIVRCCGLCRLVNGRRCPLSGLDAEDVLIPFRLDRARQIAESGSILERAGQNDDGGVATGDERLVHRQPLFKHDVIFGTDQFVECVTPSPVGFGDNPDGFRFAPIVFGLDLQRSQLLNQNTPKPVLAPHPPHTGIVRGEC